MRRTTSFYSIACLLALGAGALSAQDLSPLTPAAERPAEGPLPPSNALDKQDFEFYVRHLNLYDDRISIAVADPVESELPGMLEVKVTASYKLASKEHVYYVSEDGEFIVEGSIHRIDKNPFDKVNKRINTLSAPAFGKEGASVVVVVYSDFQCPYCAKEAQVLRTQLKNSYADKVRVYFRDYPLEIHEWAKPAAVAGRCVYMQDPDAFWAYHDWIFERQSSITPQNLADKIAEFAASQDLDSLKLTSCLSEPTAAKQVEESIEEGRLVEVTSTPALFINGRRMTGSVPWDQLKRVIDYELEYQKTARNAGDDCGCEAEIAFPE